MQIKIDTFPSKDKSWIKIKNQQGRSAFGEINPLKGRSQESFNDCLIELWEKKEHIEAIDWTPQIWEEKVFPIDLLPAVSFGIESAILDLLEYRSYKIEVSAFLSGSYQEIISKANLRKKEGYTSAKLKVCQLSFEEAKKAIHCLKDIFHLRIDVNRAWNTPQALSFFEDFPITAFDYIEEPFQNPKELHLFKHPVAVDESFPNNLSLRDLDQIPSLKALIYKPTVQGGLSKCLPIYRWSKKKKVKLVLSSSLESPLGLSHIAALSHRLGLLSPVGIGTPHSTF
jgi:O-succinylbenzoate synthase